MEKQCNGIIICKCANRVQLTVHTFMSLKLLCYMLAIASYSYWRDYIKSNAGMKQSMCR